MWSQRISTLHRRLYSPRYMNALLINAISMFSSNLGWNYLCLIFLWTASCYFISPFHQDDMELCLRYLAHLVVQGSLMQTSKSNVNSHPEFKASMILEIFELNQPWSFLIPFHTTNLLLSLVLKELVFEYSIHFLMLVHVHQIIVYWTLICLALYTEGSY